MQNSFHNTPDLFSQSPINKVKLTNQNERLYGFLMSGKSISCFSPELKTLKIGTLHSRVAEVRKYLKEEHRVKLQSKMTAFNLEDGITHANIYWIEQSDINSINNSAI